MLEDGDDAVPTPMFPAVDAGGGLAQDLRRAGVEDQAAADAAANELAAQAKAIAGKLIASDGDDDGDDDDERAGKKKDIVTAEDAGPLLALKVNGEKPYMSVSKAHMGKLRALYCRHSLGGTPLPPEGTPSTARSSPRRSRCSPGTTPWAAPATRRRSTRRRSTF